MLTTAQALIISSSQLKAVQDADKKQCISDRKSGRACIVAGTESPGGQDVTESPGHHGGEDTDAPHLSGQTEKPHSEGNHTEGPDDGGHTHGPEETLGPGQTHSPNGTNAHGQTGSPGNVNSNETVTEAPVKPLPVTDAPQNSNNARPSDPKGSIAKEDTNSRKFTTNVAKLTPANIVNVLNEFNADKSSDLMATIPSTVVSCYNIYTFYTQQCVNTVVYIW